MVEKFKSARIRVYVELQGCKYDIWKEHIQKPFTSQVIKSVWVWYGNVKSAKVKILGFFRKSVRFGLIFDTVILCGVDDFSISFPQAS